MWLYYFLLIWFLGISTILVCNKIYKIEGNELNNKKNNYTIRVKPKTIFLILCYIPLMLLCALRSVNIGNDTITYHQLYAQSIGISWREYFIMKESRWETGYLLLNKMLSSISENPQLIIIVSSIISIYLVIRFIHKYSKNPYISIYLFVTMRFYVFYMSNIRQSLALGIIMLSYDFIVSRKIVPFIISVLIASQFHTTAIVFIFAYPILNLPYKRKLILNILIFSTITFIFFNPIMKIITMYAPAKYSNYINTVYFLEATNLANIMNFCVAFAILIFFLLKYKGIYFKEMKYSVSERTRFMYLLLISVSFALISIKFGMAARIQYYFYIFSIVIIPNMISEIKEQKSKNIVTFYILMCFFMYFTIIMIFRPDWQRVYPYELFFIK